MRSWYIPFLRSLRIRTPRDESEILRPVRALGFARAFLAVFSLAAIYLDPTEPTRFAALAYSLMILYVVYSLAVLAYVGTASRVPAWIPVLFHSMDLIWATVMTLLTEGPNSPFYSFFLFVLLAAAYRWGLRATVLTTFTLGFLMLIQGWIVSTSPLVAVPVQLNRLIMRTSYMMLMGFLVGFLAEAEKQARRETAVTAKILNNIRGEAGLRGAMQWVFGSLLSIFGARRAVLRLQDESSGRRYVWEARPLADSDDCLLRFDEDESSDQGAFPRDPAWQARREANGRVRFFGLSARGTRWRESASDAPRPLLPNDSFRTALGVTVSFGQEWRGHLLLLDPHFGEARPSELNFLSNLIRQAAPILYNIYLYRRLRSRAGAIERSRVARELHDGVIQSLVSLDLQLEAVRSSVPENQEHLTADLENIQRQLHQEVLAVRELMEQMKPIASGPRDLLDFMAARVDRFRQDAGIAARFVTDIDEALMPPRVSRELGRILQEGLVNIRKHSGARNVMVRFHAQNGHWVLDIEDDGKGLDFTGRRSLAELDALRTGPAILKERVRSIGGELTIESAPGGGCRLEISVRQRQSG